MNSALITRKAKVKHDVVLAGLDAGELLEQSVTDQETNRGEESDDSDANRVVASVSFVGNDADRVLVLVFGPTLGRDAAEDDDGEQLAITSQWFLESREIVCRKSCLHKIFQLTKHSKRTIVCGFWTCLMGSKGIPALPAPKAPSMLAKLLVTQVKCRKRSLINYDIET